MTKILVLATNGMAGHIITDLLQQDSSLKIITTARNNTHINQNKNIWHINLDLKNNEILTKTIRELSPKLIINCAGILVKNSKDNPTEAIYINSLLPQLLNDLSYEYNFKLFHISTDCIFNGKKGQYKEDDISDALDIYGKTKGLGEIINTKNLTIRTSIIGPELKSNGTGLIHWLFNQTGDINGFTKAIWSGVTTLELAKFINYLITNNIDLTGIYHLTNNQTINKYDLLNTIKQAFKLEHINIHPEDNYISNKSFINTNEDIDYIVPSYEKMISELYDYIIQNSERYKHNYNFIEQITNINNTCTN